MRTSMSLFATILAASTLAAHADTYNFTITTPQATFDVTGTLTGTPDPGIPGALDLSGVTGAGQGYSFTGIVPLGTESGITYDNLLFTDPDAIHVDAEGVLLFLNSPIGTSLAHVYDSNGYHVDVLDPNDPGDVTPFSISNFELSSSVPEPTSILLMGTGLLTLAGAARRKLAR